MSFIINSVPFKRYINGRIENYTDPDFHANIWLKPTDGGNDGTAIEYIVLDQVVELLNTYFLPKNKSTKKLMSYLDWNSLYRQISAFFT